MKTIIRVKSSYKDAITEDPNHNQHRRDFIKKGVAAGAATIVLPKLLGASLIRGAMADEPACPSNPQIKGGLMHIFSEGGPTMGARFLSPVQSQFMSATVAARYGIAPDDLAAFGGNGWMLSAKSPFGQLLVPPPGVTPADWANVLRNVSVTANFGAFNQDDGGGSGLGQIAGSAGLKPGVIPSDILVNVSDARAAWSKGLSAVNVRNTTVNGATNPLAAAFTAPRGTGTDPKSWGNAVSAMNSLGQLFAGMLGTASRNGAEKFVSRGLCGAGAAASQTSATYGQTLFDPAQNGAISATTLAGLNNNEKGLLSAAFRTADGTVPGVMIEYGGRDYHGSGGQNTANRDYEEAQAIKMWLLGAYLAKAPSALIYNSNGQAIANGFTAVTVTGATGTINGPEAQGDAGGSYNGGFLLCYNPNGAGPIMRMTGTFDTTNGNVRALAALSSVPNAIASLHLTALKFLGNDVNKAFGLMQANGVSAKMSDLILLT